MMLYSYDLETGSIYRISTAGTEAFIWHNSSWQLWSDYNPPKPYFCSMLELMKAYYKDEQMSTFVRNYALKVLV